MLSLITCLYVTDNQVIILQTLGGLILYQISQITIVISMCKQIMD